VADFRLGFGGGCHYACEYEWHEQGRGMPRPAASVLQWMNKEEIDDLFLKGLKLAASKTVLHRLGRGMDAQESRGNALTAVAVPAESTASGVEETVFVEYAADGDVTYIGAEEEVAGMQYENPHPNSEQFAMRVLRECLQDLGWPYELLDMKSGGRSPTRLTCITANKSIWERQSTGWERMLEFTRYAVAVGMNAGFIPRNDAGMDPYLWEFGLPAELSVDEGNAVKASLDKLRMGLTTQDIEAAKDGRVVKSIRAQRKKEVFGLIDDADDAVKYAKAKGHDMPFVSAMEKFYQSGSNPQSPPQPKPEAKPQPTNPAP